jgi:SynChlorMet cassette protein ScmD
LHSSYEEETELATDDRRPTANPIIVLREEFDDWAVLFDPDTGEGYGLNPVCVFVWKRLDGMHTVENIVTELHENDCRNMPEDAGDRIQAFVEDLVGRGLAGYELQKV